MDSLESIFRKKIPMIWKDYEPRESQIRMSVAVNRAILDKKTAIVEAGTGVGKSLAYLIPAALYSLERKELIVVSTETKALQEQLVNKDIPLVEEILGSEIRAEIAMGSSNYLCLRKYQAHLKEGSFPPSVVPHLDRLQKWVERTETGMRTEFSGHIPPDAWATLGRESDNCLGKHCKNLDRSFYFREKEKWKNSNILIVNHALLSYHIAGGFRLLPSFAHLIIDEAHNFPEVFGNSLRMEVNFDSCKKILNYLASNDPKISLMGKIPNSQRVVNLVDECRSFLAGVFDTLIQEVGILFQGSYRINKPLRLDSGRFESSLKNLEEHITHFMEKYSLESEETSSKEIAIGLEMSLGRIQTIRKFFTELRTRENPNLVFWVEPPNQDKVERHLKLFSQPINVDEILAEELKPNLDSCVFTSATIATGKKDFHFYQKEIGFSVDASHQFPSPFDYPNQALIYLPNGIRDPKEDEWGFHKDITEEIDFLIRTTQGCCFVLFTSNRSLNMVRQALEHRIPFPIVSQANLGAVRAQKAFLEIDNAVLFGVSSFWQGVDIKGDKLRSVIITKLPFQVPTEPVLQTKMENLKKKNLDPFRDFQMPYAGILLKQGFGRLIRSMTDTGVVSILDPRIQTKAYGKQFLAGFPEGIKTLKTRQDLVSNFEKLPKLVI